ncbi:metal-dependent transcriptional regulator [Pedobacter changchengzhani]|uniref:Transcriptional regulator MntR n=1 Tax=Pedobacter changchengzhani TaxID=2529274 RepID=A0A4R5MHP0_9SPHI|nr:metal-dependent transcriptional regulator [Pedobacter changchengzhani]TDG35042.1 metal-dependent transcriptional regulator [Pedobacter changchengzhani]
MQSFTEENYLKIIYHLSDKTATVQTNAIAEQIQTKPASVTDMLKKLSEKGLVDYVKYQGASLTAKGRDAAIKVVRKHRLWEVFLVDKLNFKWDEVHEVAEQLEHIKSAALVERLDSFLGFPKIDPHGDPIPDKNGKFEDATFTKLIELSVNDFGTITGVSEHSSPYLKHLEKIGLTLGKQIKVVAITEFDGSLEIIYNDTTVNVSREVAKHILITKLHE